MKEEKKKKTKERDRIEESIENRGEKRMYVVANGGR